MKSKIIALEDNAETREALRKTLASEFDFSCAQSPTQGIRIIQEQSPHLVLLDVMMPTMTGFEVCSILKNDPNTKNIPIIFLTARQSSEDIVEGLGLGADDYIVKPFDPNILLARIRARLRSRSINHGNLRVVLDTRDVFYNGKEVKLTGTEFEILRILLQRPHEIISRDLLLKEIKKSPSYKSKQRTIDVHVRAIRKKIPVLDHHIISVYGSGYKFEP